MFTLQWHQLEGVLCLWALAELCMSPDANGEAAQVLMFLSEQLVDLVVPVPVALMMAFLSYFHYDPKRAITERGKRQ